MSGGKRKVSEGERGRKKGGGSEGLGGGDGGKDSYQNPHDEGGKSFAFGQAPEKQRVTTDVNSRSTSGINSGASKLSCRDKLVSPGCVGFLVQHSEEDDIVKGWKDYFHRMNEHAPQGDQGNSEEEDEQTSRRVEGRPGKLEFTADEYTTWCLPWRNSLIIKVLGAYFPTYNIRDRINRIWRPKNPLKLIPLSNGYYIVSFSNKEDREYAFKEGPWMIDDHYLIVQRWRPNFNPWKADLQCNIAAWIRLPNVPFEFYNIESLRRLGNIIGKMIKVDRSTSIYDKGGFACICVEIDLKKPLVPTYMVFGEERPIIYEGLHLVCFECGKYGHKKEACPINQTQVPLPGNTSHTEDPDVGGDGVSPHAEKPSVDGITPVIPTEGGDTKVVGGCVSEGSPFGKIWILRQDFRGNSGPTDFRKGSNGALGQGVDQGHDGGKHDTRRIDGKKDNKGVMAEVNGGSVNHHRLVKSEWVPVGSNRKFANKGKVKGKENHNPAFGRLQRNNQVGLANGLAQVNSFSSLQEIVGQDTTNETRPHDRGSDGVTLGSTNAPIISISPLPGQLQRPVSSMTKMLEDNLQPQQQDAQHQKSDVLMADQDKTEGEVAISQSTLTISQ
ncbi:hypothetical protein K1719_017629 [Acacia pycnantha]|nr:hypothetical protein K1719_017629 [Acacia pycnantha]